MTHATVVTMDPQRQIIPDGAVAIDGGRIVAVATAAEIKGRYRARTTLDARGTLLIPGLVNAHTHAPMVLFRGIADDLALMDWLQGTIFPAEKANVTAAFVKSGTRLAALEMIRSGTTTFADMYYFEDQVAEAAKEAGLRVVAGETLIEFPAPDNKSIPAALAYTERFLARWKDDPLVTAAVAPHSAYLAGPETLRSARDLADRFEAPILTHLSESAAEQQQIRERYGRTPTEHLREVGLLRKGVLGAHGVWLTASDRSILKSAGAGVAHCPQSNMKLASGAAPVREMLGEGLALGLGTDGAASNNDQDMFEEMLSAALLAKQTSGDPTAAPAAAVLEMATLGGARSLGMEDRIGSIEAG
ncbi:MAG TPA: amidohydrolase, partial [Vicinamibacteria bacterium]|nr:amidohydrolase [Vicinamibacteria bacterium]